MGIIAEELAVKKLGEENAVVYVCQKGGWVARGFEPKKCTVCQAGPEKFQKLDREAIEELGPLEGAIHEENAFDNVRLKYTNDALDLIRSLPEDYQRRRIKAQVEKRARVRKQTMITKEMVEEVVGQTEAGAENVEDGDKRGQREAEANVDTSRAAKESGSRNTGDGVLVWTPEAIERLNRVPEGFMRNASKKSIEKLAAANKTDLIDLTVVEEGIRDGLKIMEEMNKKRKGRNEDT